MTRLILLPILATLSGCYVVEVDGFAGEPNDDTLVDPLFDDDGGLGSQSEEEGIVSVSFDDLDLANLSYGAKFGDDPTPQTFTVMSQRKEDSSARGYRVAVDNSLSSGDDKNLFYLLYDDESNSPNASGPAVRFGGVWIRAEAPEAGGTDRPVTETGAFAGCADYTSAPHVACEAVPAPIAARGANSAEYEGIASWVDVGLTTDDNLGADTAGSEDYYTATVSLTVMFDLGNGDVTGELSGIRRFADFSNIAFSGGEEFTGNLTLRGPGSQRRALVSDDGTFSGRLIGTLLLGTPEEIEMSEAVSYSYHGRWGGRFYEPSDGGTPRSAVGTLKGFHESGANNDRRDFAGFWLVGIPDPVAPVLDLTVSGSGDMELVFDDVRGDPETEAAFTGDSGTIRNAGVLGFRHMQIDAENRFDPHRPLQLDIYTDYHETSKPSGWIGGGTWILTNGDANEIAGAFADGDNPATDAASTPAVNARYRGGVYGMLVSPASTEHFTAVLRLEVDFDGTMYEATGSVTEFRVYDPDAGFAGSRPSEQASSAYSAELGTAAGTDGEFSGQFSGNLNGAAFTGGSWGGSFYNPVAGDAPGAAAGTLEYDGTGGSALELHASWLTGAKVPDPVAPVLDLAVSGSEMDLVFDDVLGVSATERVFADNVGTIFPVIGEGARRAQIDAEGSFDPYRPLEVDIYTDYHETLKPSGWIGGGTWILKDGNAIEIAGAFADGDDPATAAASTPAVNASYTGGVAGMLVSRAAAVPVVNHFTADLDLTAVFDGTTYSVSGSATELRVYGDDAGYSGSIPSASPDTVHDLDLEAATGMDGEFSGALTGTLYSTAFTGGSWGGSFYNPMAGEAPSTAAGTLRYENPGGTLELHAFWAAQPAPIAGPNFDEPGMVTQTGPDPAITLPFDGLELDDAVIDIRLHFGVLNGATVEDRGLPTPPVTTTDGDGNSFWSYRDVYTPFLDPGNPQLIHILHEGSEQPSGDSVNFGGVWVSSENANMDGEGGDVNGVAAFAGCADYSRSNHRACTVGARPAPASGMYTAVYSGIASWVDADDTEDLESGSDTLDYYTAAVALTAEFGSASGSIGGEITDVRRFDDFADIGFSGGTAATGGLELGSASIGDNGTFIGSLSGELTISSTEFSHSGSWGGRFYEPTELGPDTAVGTFKGTHTSSAGDKRFAGFWLTEIATPDLVLPTDPGLAFPVTEMEFSFDDLDGNPVNIALTDSDDSPLPAGARRFRHAEADAGNSFDPYRLLGADIYTDFDSSSNPTAWIGGGVWVLRDSHDDPEAAGAFADGGTPATGAASTPVATAEYAGGVAGVLVDRSGAAPVANHFTADLDLTAVFDGTAYSVTGTATELRVYGNNAGHAGAPPDAEADTVHDLDLGAATGMDGEFSGALTGTLGGTAFTGGTWGGSFYNPVTGAEPAAAAGTLEYDGMGGMGTSELELHAFWGADFLTPLPGDIEFTDTNLGTNQESIFVQQSDPAGGVRFADLWLARGRLYFEIDGSTEDLGPGGLANLPETELGGQTTQYRRVDGTGDEDRLSLFHVDRNIGAPRGDIHLGGIWVRNSGDPVSGVAEIGAFSGCEDRDLASPHRCQPADFPTSSSSSSVSAMYGGFAAWMDVSSDGTDEDLYIAAADLSAVFWPSGGSVDGSITGIERFADPGDFPNGTSADLSGSLSLGTAVIRDSDAGSLTFFGDLSGQLTETSGGTSTMYDYSGTWAGRFFDTESSGPRSATGTFEGINDQGGTERRFAGFLIARRGETGSGTSSSSSSATSSVASGPSRTVTDFGSATDWLDAGVWIQEDGSGGVADLGAFASAGAPASSSAVESGTAATYSGSAAGVIFPDAGDAGGFERFGAEVLLSATFGSGASISGTLSGFEIGSRELTGELTLGDAAIDADGGFSGALSGSLTDGGQVHDLSGGWDGQLYGQAGTDAPDSAAGTFAAGDSFAGFWGAQR